MFLPYCRVSQ